MVCVVGYSTAVRPPVSVTEPIKAAVMHAYGDRGPPSEYELDHLVPLELGGAPRDLRNMWPEPTAAARVKDRRENALHRQVCAGLTSLAAAQQEMAGW